MRDGIEERIRELEERLEKARAQIDSIRSELTLLKEEKDRPSAPLVAALSQSNPDETRLQEPGLRPIESRYESTETERQDSIYVENPISSRSPFLEQPITESWVKKSLTLIKNKISERIGEIPIEEFIGKNLLNRAGLLLLIVGFSFFLRIAYGWIGPAGKAILVGLFGAALAGFGEFLFRKRRYPVFSQGLVAAGGSLIYFTGYAIANIESMRMISNPLIGYILLVVLSSLLIALSIRFNSEALTGFAYFLAFLSISINESGEFNYFSMAALTLLASSLIVVLALKQWKYLTGPGLIASYFNFYLYSQTLPRNAGGYVLRASDADPTDHFLYAFLFLLVFWIIFSASVFTLRILTARDRRIAATLHVVNAFTFVGMLAWIRPEPAGWSGFFLTAGLAAAYVGMAIAGRRIEREFLWNTGIPIAAGLLMLAFPMAFSENARQIGWLLESTLLISLGFILKEKSLKYTGYASLVLKMFFFAYLYVGSVDNTTGDLFRLDWDRGLLLLFMTFCFFFLTVVFRIFTEASSQNYIDDVMFLLTHVAAAFSGIALSVYMVRPPYQAFSLSFLVIVLGAVLLVFRSKEMLFHILLFLTAALFYTMSAFSEEMLQGQVLTLYCFGSLAVSSAAGALYSRFSYSGKFRLFQWKYFEKQDASFERRINKLTGEGAVFILLAAISMAFRRFLPFEYFSTAGLAFFALTFLAARRLKFGRISLFIFFIFYLIRLFVDASRISEVRANDPVTWSGGALIVYAIMMIFLSLKEDRQKPEAVGNFGRMFLFRWKFSRHLHFTGLSAAILVLAFRHFQSPALPAIILAGALGVLLIFWRVRAAGLYSILLFTAGFAAGPAFWFFAPPDFTLHYGFIYALVFFLFSLTLATVVFLKSDRTFYEWPAAYVLAFTGICILAEETTPAEVLPSILAAGAFIHLFLSRQFQDPFLKFTALAPLLAAGLDYFYLLQLIYRSPGSPATEFVAGLVPLAFLSGSLRKEFFTPSIRIAAAVVMLLNFVLLSMALFDPDWWSICWVILALFAIGGGIYRRMPWLRYSGFALSALAVAKIGIWDLRKLEDTIRVIVITGMGGIFVVVSYLYAKFSSRLFTWLGPEEKNPGADSEYR